ncbi:MAG: glutamyl-tRNA reductase [Bacteroidetes bacterium]|nr:glutamyl-tRNA reductase [Bacteroidota bacterium]
MNAFKIIAFTHKTADLKNIGDLHIDDVLQQERLSNLKHNSNLQELLFLSTCNRVEFLFSTSEAITEEFTISFIQAAYPHFSITEVSQLAAGCLKFEGKEAMRHLLQVASSIDSLVVGEREIITQVRNAYDKSLGMNLTGDLLRLVIKRAIETAKQVYTETQIAHKPVSIVSLAYRKLKDLNVRLDARFVIIGAGQTNQLMAKFLKKHGFTNFVVFNRTLANGEKLAMDLNGKAYSLTELTHYSGGFDVILTCTASAEHIIDSAIYTTLARGEKGKKIIIDLSIPTDIEPSVISDNKPYYIDITALQAMASENLKSDTRN